LPRHRCRFGPPGGVAAQGNVITPSNSFLGGGKDEQVDSQVGAAPIVRFGGRRGRIGQISKDGKDWLK